jgi:hypothetical protein
MGCLCADTPEARTVTGSERSDRRSRPEYSREHVTSQFAIRCIVALLLVWATGCVIPLPHWVVRLPRVTGTLLRDGVPVAGASVLYAPGPYVSRDPTCESPERQSTITSSSGMFELPGIRAFRLLEVITPGSTDFGFRWTICLETADGSRRTWSGSSFGPPSAPTLIEVSCDLGKPEVCSYVTPPPGIGVLGR